MAEEPAETPRRRASDATVDALGAHVDRLAGSVTTLVDEVREDQKWRKRFIRGLGVAIGLLLIFSTVQLLDAFVGWRTRNEIRDCTTPEGECYRLNAERSQELVTAIVCSQDANTRVIVAAIGTDFGATVHLPPQSEQCAAYAEPLED